MSYRRWKTWREIASFDRSLKEVNPAAMTVELAKQSGAL